MEHAQALTDLKSPRPDQVITSLRYLKKNGTIADLSAVMALICNENTRIRKSAADAACSIIKKNLITNFSQLTPELRHKLGSILQTLDPLIVDEISKDLFCDDEDRRLISLQILGILRRHPRTRELLAKLVQDRDVKIKATAVSLLGKMVGPHDHEVVLALLNDTDKRVRANTVEALESLGNKRMVPVLLRLRHDPNNRIRANVLKALYNLGYGDVEQDLLSMLNSGEDLMKASALWVVSQIKLKSSAIEDASGLCLLSDNPMVFQNATNALKALNTSRSAGYLKYLENVFR